MEEQSSRSEYHSIRRAVNGGNMGYLLPISPETGAWRREQQIRMRPRPSADEIVGQAIITLVGCYFAAHVAVWVLRSLVEAIQ